MFTDINKPTEFHMKLLANPEFDFTPFWDEAVINWLHRNTSRLLRHNPHCCKYFIGDREQKSTIADNIPLDNNDDLLAFMRTLVASDWPTFYDISDRLVKAGKVDLIAEAKPEVFFAIQRSSTHDPVELIEKLSDKSIAKLLDHAPWDVCHWDATTLAAFVKRIPPERLKEIKVEYIPYKKRKHRYSEWSEIHKDRNRTACLIASIIPKEDLKDFIARITPFISLLDCMSCGEFKALSKSGYTLHMKSCDHLGLHPNVYMVAANRL